MQNERAGTGSVRFAPGRAKSRIPAGGVTPSTPGNYICGLTIVGEPVINRGRVSHIIVGIGLSEQFKLSCLARLAKDLVAAAQDTSLWLRSD